MGALGHGPNDVLTSLTTIALRVDDGDDHPGGGHCVSLAANESQGTRELVEQYLAALQTVAAQAAESVDGGWELTRPLLFHAHHTCELAAKSALLAGRVAFETRHGLPELWASLSSAGLTEVLDTSEQDWCHDFVAFIADLAGNSIGARYARPNPGRAAIDDLWCCVNPTALFEATEHFAIRCIAIVQAAEE